MEWVAIQDKFKTFGLRSRPSQHQMIEHVYQSIQKKCITCVEAPTGTGKTLGYLLAAYYGRSAKQTVVISTATIALQEQLVRKDLPLIEQMLGQKIRYTLAKGRQNYLCLAKLYAGEDEHDSMIDMFKDYVAVLKEQIECYGWDGDKETLDLEKGIKDQEWKTVITDTAGCSGAACPYYERCFFFKARNKIYAADFIVTNHSLLLSDLELGGGVLLPNPENNIYIIDECHHLPERAMTHFSKSAYLMNSIDWLNAINFNVQRAISGKILAASTQTRINTIIASIVSALQSLKVELDLNQNMFHDEAWRILPDQVEKFDSAKLLRTFSSDLQVALRLIGVCIEKEQQAEGLNEEKKQLLKKYSTSFKFLLSRAEAFAATWALFSDMEPLRPGDAPIARWFQKVALKNGMDYVCHCAPIYVGQHLRTMLWDRLVHAAILCSATIRSLGAFTNFLRKTGLHQVNLPDGVLTCVIPPIFNYERSVLFIPRMQNEPTGDGQKGHHDEVVALLPELILPRSGTLVLFTSHSAMHDIYQQLVRGALRDERDDILMQGEKNKLLLITAHKKKIDQGKRSIIFGLTSFAEGIDLPARYCQHVIIHKLPFAVPTDPVELTRAEWMQQHRMNPFLLATLPDTAMKLTQYVGRLIRQEEDMGIVSILDRRMYSKSYGQQLLQSLPPFTRLIQSNLEQLKQHSAVRALFL